MIRRLLIIMKSPVHQYLIGSLISLSYIFILIIGDTSYKNLQLPEGIYAENLWKAGDVQTYVQPARNFLIYGVFGSEDVPDYHRSIGYPLFLCTLMALFGSQWLFFAFFIQMAMFASIYPALSRISLVLFGNVYDSDNVIILPFLFFIVAGTYIAMLPAVMTDTFFAVFFTLGLCFGLECIVKKSWRYLLLHILFTGYAAQVRPVLGFYPIIDSFVLCFIASKYYISNGTKERRLIIVSFISLLLICNLPTFRNYINYGSLKPADAMSINMFEHLGREVLWNVNRSEDYYEMKKLVEGEMDPYKRSKILEQFAMKIYKSYPLMTLRQLAKNAIGIMGRAHWSYAAGFWGYSFQDDAGDNTHVQVKKSSAVYLIEIFFNLVYLLVYLLFFSFLVRNYRLKNRFFLLAIILVISYLLIPTFVVNAQGSRMRLPAEGLIVLMAFRELQYYLDGFKIPAAN